MCNRHESTGASVSRGRIVVVTVLFHQCGAGTKTLEIRLKFRLDLKLINSSVLFLPDMSQSFIQSQRGMPH